MIQGTLPPVACLEPEVLGALAEGRLAGAERDAAVRHLAGCRRCHEVFASTVQILEEEGALPVVAEDAAVAAAKPDRSPVVWLSAAAAALTSLVLFVQRAPVAIPRVAQASPTPTAQATATPTAAVTPGPVNSASLPSEALAALQMLNGYESPYADAGAVGFAPNPRAQAVARGIADIDAVARALARRTPAPAFASDGRADDWRRAGRILEASRLALLDPAGKPEAFFKTPWASAELTSASRLLRDAEVRDAAWADDVRSRSASIDGEAAQALLARLDAILEAVQ
jgi:hypothetical protein